MSSRRRYLTVARPNMQICTVATLACVRGLSILLASLDRCGWDLEVSPVRVYVPEGDALPELPGTVLVQRPVWWQGTRMADCRNAAALLKADAMSDGHWRDGDVILYLDAADIAVLEHPRGILEEMERCKADVALRPFPPRTRYHRWRLSHATKGKELPPAHLGRVFAADYAADRSYYNNGVIGFRAGPLSRMAGMLWRGYLIAEAQSDVSSMGCDNRDNKLVGDQHMLNLVLRQCPLKVADLQVRWNSMGGARPRQFVMQPDGTWLDPIHGRVSIAHASGSHALPAALVAAATAGSRYAVLPGGTGLAADQRRAAAAGEVAAAEAPVDATMGSYAPILRAHLPAAGSRVIEWGPGGSTQMMLDAGLVVHSIEHDPAWWRQAQAKWGLHPNWSGQLLSATARHSDYATAAIPRGSFDLAFVDGRRRVECVLAAMQCTHGPILLHDWGRANYQALLRPIPTLKIVEESHGTVVMLSTTVPTCQPSP